MKGVGTESKHEALMNDELFIDLQASYLAYFSLSICTGSRRIR